jgi:pentose-5-phosphate-3-epimerase
MVEADRGIKADNMSRATSAGAKVIGSGSDIFQDARSRSENLSNA